jgi:predicted lysophospholipase L1 biosynthesis ABC-type transport system permease subunit
LTFDGLAALSADPYRASYLVELAPGAGGAAALRREFGDLAFGPQHPPDLRNYERVRAVPLALGLVLGLVGAGTLAHALAATVRGRRRDLALFKALGFTRPQVWSAVAWQAATVAAVTVLIGAPLGVALGRRSWTLLAEYLAVPSGPASVVPVLAVAVPATFALALLLAAGPAWRAARMAPASVLRAE